MQDDDDGVTVEILRKQGKRAVNECRTPRSFYWRVLRRKISSQVFFSNACENVNILLIYIGKELACFFAERRLF